MLFALCPAINCDPFKYIFAKTTSIVVQSRHCLIEYRFFFKTKSKRCSVDCSIHALPIASLQLLCHTYNCPTWSDNHAYVMLILYTYNSLNLINIARLRSSSNTHPTPNGSTSNQTTRSEKFRFNLCFWPSQKLIFPIRPQQIVLI